MHMVNVTTTKMYNYRIYPFKNQQRILHRQLDLACEMYNNLLDIKQERWKKANQNLTKTDLNNIIAELKADDPK